MGYFSKLLSLSILFFASPTLSDDIFDSIDSVTTQEKNFDSDIFSSIEEKEISYGKVAKIIVMNKITANSKEFVLNIGSKVVYGKAEIELHKCAKLKAKREDNVLLVSLKEKGFNNDVQLVFRGWLFSNSPSLSAIEHPVYQLIAVSCG